MAQVTSGSFNTSRYTDPDGDYKYLTFAWTATQSVEKNESTISWTLKGVGNSGYLMAGPFTVVIDGATVYSSSTRIELRNGTLVASGSKKLSHSDAGVKSFSASVSAAIYTYAVSSTGSGSWDLKDIPRASEPTVSASSVTMGNALTITTNRKATAFTHTLSYKFGTASRTIDTGVGDSYDWTVPELSAYCNNATSGTCTITCITYNGSSKVGEKTVNVTLNVPSASVPTVSPSTVVMGNILTILTNRKSSNFKHKLSYSFNGATGTLDTDATTSFSWHVPLDLAKQIKDKTSGDGTITCVTYNGTATVGTKTVSFKASVPNSSTTQPSVSSLVLAPYGTVPSAFSGLYIQTKTGIKATFTATSTYSTISSYKMTIGSITRDGNPAILTSFSTAGDKTVIGTVTDARGYSTSVTKSVTVLPYGIPKVVPYSGEKAVICERCTSDGTINDAGTCLRLKVGRNYSKVMAGATQKNFCSLGIRYKTSTTSSYSSDTILISSDGKHTYPVGTKVVTESDNVDELDIAIPNIVASPTTSYDVRIFAKDTMGEETTYDVPIPTAGTDFHLREGGDGGAFGKYSEEADLLEVDWNFKANKKTTVASLLFEEHEIFIGGDKDIYYPVHVKPSSALNSQPIFLGVGKMLETESPEWEGNHSKGFSSLSMGWIFRFNGWDGSGFFIKPLYKAEPYAPLIAHISGLTSSVPGVVIYLRGGGASYKIACSSLCDINVYLEETNISVAPSHEQIVTPITSYENGNKGVLYYGTEF